MSTLLYAAQTTKRIKAEAKTSRDTAPPGTTPVADALAALVPAEVLALSTLLGGFLTDSVPAGDKVTTTFNHPDLSEKVYWVLLVLAAGLYLLGRLSGGGRLAWLDLARAPIPVLAMVFWTMLIPGSGFDLITDRWDSTERSVYAAIAAVVLGAVAAALGYKVDRADAK